MSEGQPTSRTLVRRVNQLYHKLTQQRFDADHYWRHRAERSFWQQVGRQVLGDSRCSSRTVVDLACGTGFVSESLATWLTPRDQIVAIDVDDAPLHSTRAKWQQVTRYQVRWPGLRLIACDGHQLPLAAGSVDLLAINAALHHLPDVGAVLVEIDRVLKPGGWFALGFEPNRVHFRSPLADWVRILDRIGWYANLQQNRRRVREMLCRYRQSLSVATTTAALSVCPGGDTEAAEAIGRQLAAEKLTDRPLSVDGVMDLVDPHARGGKDQQGFDCHDLLRQHLGGYQVHMLNTSDYLGETIRRFPQVRRAVDRLFGMAAPRHGSLFSWLVRKPAAATQEESPCVE